MNDDQIRILFLAANPKATVPLDLNGEYEKIETTLRESSLTKSILLQHRWKLNREQLLDFFLQYRPHVVHFSGHGTEDNLILQDKEGNAWPLDRKTAREAFKTTSNVTHLVVLNACYSRDVAEDISEVVDCVIGMSQPVYDNTAVRFAGSLYRGIGEGLCVSDAFERARTEIKVSGLPGANVPQIVSRPGLDPRKVFPMDWLKGEARPSTIQPLIGKIDSGLPIDRPTVRKLLNQKLLTDPDFDGFVGEYFGEVARRFSGGMDRVAKMNLLFALKDPAEVHAALEKHLS